MMHAKGLRNGTWLQAGLLAACCLAGCKREAPVVAVPGGGASLLFEIEKEDGFDPTALAAMVTRRLQAFGVERVQVLKEGPRLIRVLLPGAGEKEVERAEWLITRPVQMGITALDPGLDFFAALKKDLPADGSVQAAVDKLGGPEIGQSVSVGYLIGTDREKLEQVIGKLQPPANRRLAILPSTRGALAYLVEEPPRVRDPVLTEVRVIEDEVTGQARMSARLSGPYRQAFMSLVQENHNRPLAFVVDGQVRALPLVLADGTPKNGRFEITPSPLVPDKPARFQAEQLAVSLKAWDLVGGFKLVQKTLSPTGG